MGDVIGLAGYRHACGARAGFRKASIGTSPPDISLNRLARPSDAVLRPATRLRKCASEHSAACASSRTLIPLSDAQRIIKCGSAMGLDISTRNAKCQPKIFPVEISGSNRPLIKCDMGKRTKPEPQEIFLGHWLKHFGIGPNQAAVIAGCTQSYISNISGGRRAHINALYLLRLSEEMGVTINDFFRPIPTQSQVAAFDQLSPQAQAALLRRK